MHISAICFLISGIFLLQCHNHFEYIPISETINIPVVIILFTIGIYSLFLRVCYFFGGTILLKIDDYGPAWYYVGFGLMSFGDFLKEFRYNDYFGYMKDHVVYHFHGKTYVNDSLYWVHRNPHAKAYMHILDHLLIGFLLNTLVVIFFPCWRSI